MSVSKVAAEKGKDAPSGSSAPCGFMISGRDPHPMCIACMGVKHAQAVLVDAESCTHCRVMPARILERRLQVAAKSSKDDSFLSTIHPSAKGAQHSPPQDLSSWGDIMFLEYSEFAPLFDHQPLVPGDEVERDEKEAEMLACFLQDELDDEEDDAILSAAQASRPMSVQGGGLASTMLGCDLVSVRQLRLVSLGLGIQELNGISKTGKGSLLPFPW